jgi:AraC-like DNA-binding protein
MTVYAPMIGSIWRNLDSYVIDPNEVIPAKHYRPGRKSTYSGRISFADYDAIQAHAASLIRDSAMGLRSASLLHPSHLGALGHAWLASSSLRTALRRAERFVRMFHEQIEFTLDESQGCITATYKMLRQPTRPGLVGDGQIAGLLKLCRINYGESLVPAEVRLKRPTPPNPEPWTKFFGTDVKFGQPANGLSISNVDADRPLTGSDPEMIALHEEMIQRYLMKHDRANILNRARLQIMEELPTGGVTEDGTARALHMSKRTLHRKLRENDETFRSLLTQVRTGLAERYIVNDSYTVTEIAFLLGYTDTSAFSRAFRTWFDRSPTQAREQSQNL